MPVRKQNSALVDAGRCAGAWLGDTAEQQEDFAYGKHFTVCPFFKFKITIYGQELPFNFFF